MDEVLKSELIQEQDGYTVILHLDLEQTEFAKELGEITTLHKSNPSFYSRIQDYVRSKYPNVKVQAVKIIVGSMMVTTIPFSQVHHAEAHEVDYNMSYQFIGTPSTLIKQVQQTQGNLNTVAPSFFELDASGNLVLTSQFSTYYIDQVHAEGVKVVPYITNNWTRSLGRTALANRDALSTQIADAIKKYNLDGINVDIENVTEVDRDNYTDFVRLLRAKIPADKEVSVAVAANPSGWKTGWQGSYDYNKLAQYADYLMLMAYDESWEGGPEGPVASLPWVEKSIQAVLNSGVPGSKVVLGLPFYGRYWIEGQTYGGYGITNAQVNNMISRYNGTTTYDPVARSPEATITIKPGDPSYTVSGRTLGPGTYHIWYENNDSLQEKIALVHKYELKGTGSWALGEENPDIWNYYDTWVNEEAFRDVKSNYWAHDAIMNVKDKGWMIGKTSTSFAPDDHLTRAEAAVIFVRALGLEAIDGTDAKFSDVPDDFWAKNEIAIATQHGLFHGRDAAHFDPNAEITREEMAVVLNNKLNNVSNNPSAAAMPFSDVSPDRWSASAILAMYKQGIINGYPDGSFGPKDPLTRAEMAALMDRIGDQLGAE